jgi:hypothetical protein
VEANVESTAMTTEPVVLIPQCAECRKVWLPTDDDCWRAYLGAEDLDELAEIVFYCPECAARQFDDVP